MMFCVKTREPNYPNFSVSKFRNALLFQLPVYDRYEVPGLLYTMVPRDWQRHSEIITGKNHELFYLLSVYDLVL
jgi:hypothetical protein